MKTVEIYVGATAGFSIDALTRSVEQFVTGKVERENRAYVPSTDELSENIAMWERALAQINSQRAKPAETLVTYAIGEKPPEGFVPLGPVSVDFGKGTIDLSGKTYAEKEAILAAGGQEPIDTERHAELPDNVRKALGAKVGSF